MILCEFAGKFSNGLIKRKAAAYTYWKPDIVSVALGSDERRILITSAHVIKCLAHAEFQSRRQLAAVAGGYRVGPGVTKCI